MTMPLIIYLGIIFLSLFDPTFRFHDEGPSGSYFLSEMDVLLRGGQHLPDKIMSSFGVVLMVYVTVQLNLKQKGLLITTGSFHVAGNPQNFGAILLRNNLTSRSFREAVGNVEWVATGDTLAKCGLITYIP